MPTSMTLGQIVQPVQEGQALPLQHGIELAKAQQDMQKKQVETQQLQNQLDDQKWSSFKGMMDTYTRAAPEIQKAMKNQLGGRFKQIGADPSILDAVSSDDQAQKWRTISNSMNSSDPNVRAIGLQAMQNIGTFADATDHAFQMYDNQAKGDIATKLGAQKAQTQIIVGGGHDAAKVDAAHVQAESNPRLLSSQTAANNAYSKQMGPQENALNQADRALGIISKIDDNKLKSTKLLASDLEAAQASLLGGGKPSTVYGQQAVHMDDMYSRAENAIQFITANPQDTQSKAKLAQLKLDLSALRDFYDEQHAQNYTAYKEGVPEKFRPGLDKRYQTFRSLHGLSSDFAQQPGQAPTAGGTPPPAASGADNLSDNQKVYVQKAQGLKKADGSPYSMDEIMQMMKKKGVK